MKKLVIFLIITALILVLTPSIIYAGKSSVEKATGEIEVVPITGPDGDTRMVEFNAHEAKNEGIFLWTQTDGITTTYHEVIIDDVEVGGDGAEFSGIAVVSTSTTGSTSTITDRQGLRLFIKVLDDSPDILWLYWDDELDYYEYNVVDGNIVVHGVTSTTDPDGSSKAAILMERGVPGEGLALAPGLQKQFNPKSQAGGKAGKK